MKFKFLHFSDAHLGYQQYNSKDRFNDFGRVFLHIVDQAIERRVDFVISGGDLFQKRSIDPPTLLQAIAGLSRLKERGIPVYAVEGNHERAHYRDRYSWSEFLEEQGYLALLNPEFEEGKPVMRPWNGHQGAYIDHTLPDSNGESQDTVRIYGLKYYGSTTARVIEGMAEALASQNGRPPGYNILIMHAGLDDVLDHLSATVPYRQMAPLKNYVQYMALGHVHKPYEREDWLFNPGPAETCSAEEIDWQERGYYLVEVDTGQEPVHRAQLVSMKDQRRPFLRIRLDVAAYHTPQALYEAAGREVRQLVSRQRGSSSKPVLHIHLSGVLPFSTQDMDLKQVEQIAQDILDPLLVRIHNRTMPTEFEIDADENLSRAQLERQVINDLLQNDERFRWQAEDWGKLVLDVKRMVLENSDPDLIIQHLADSRLAQELE